MNADQNVLGLDVTMDDVLLVEVLQSRRHLCNVLRSLPFRESLFTTEMLVQLAFSGEFKNQKDTLAVMKMTEQTKDVGVCQIRLDLDFSPDLLLDFALLKFRLVQHLQSADKTRRSLSRQIYATEFTLTQRLANLEHSEVKLFGHRWLCGRVWERLDL